MVLLIIMEQKENENHTKENCQDMLQNTVKEKIEDTYTIIDNKEKLQGFKMNFKRKCSKNIQRVKNL